MANAITTIAAVTMTTIAVIYTGSDRTNIAGIESFSDHAKACEFYLAAAKRGFYAELTGAIEV